VLLVDADETELTTGANNARTRANRDFYLARTKRGHNACRFVHRVRCAARRYDCPAVPETGHELRRERDFGHEHDDSASKLEAARRCTQVHLGFARRGDALEQKACRSPRSRRPTTASTARACAGVSTGGTSGATSRVNGSTTSSCFSSTTAPTSTRRATAARAFGHLRPSSVSAVGRARVDARESPAPARGASASERPALHAPTARADPRSASRQSQYACAALRSTAGRRAASPRPSARGNSARAPAGNRVAPRGAPARRRPPPRLPSARDAARSRRGPVPLAPGVHLLGGPTLAASVRGVRACCASSGDGSVLGVVLDVGEREPMPHRTPEGGLGGGRRRAGAPEELLDFLQELARYYLAPMGEVMQLARPRSSAARRRRYWLCPRRGPWVGSCSWRVQCRTLRRRCSAGGRRRFSSIYARTDDGAHELGRKWPNAASGSGAPRRSRRRRTREATRRSLTRSRARSRPTCRRCSRRRKLAPSDAVVGRLERGERQAFLLEGITASGKTEVYLRAAARCLELGRESSCSCPKSRSRRNSWPVSGHGWASYRRAAQRTR